MISYENRISSRFGPYWVNNYCNLLLYDPMHSSQNLPHFWLTVHAINDQIVLNCDISHADESTFKKEISKANV